MHPLADTLGLLIVQLCRAHRQHAEIELRKLGLHAGQEMILLHLAREEGLPQSHLAERMGVEPPTITKMLQRMDGLIERRPDAEDARVSRVYLTPQARGLYQPVLDFWRDLDQLTVAGLSDAEQAQLHSLLARVVANLGKGSC